MDVVELAVQLIKEGGLVVYPTDTLYGLGADIFNAEAIGKVFEAKDRPSNAPISVAVDGPDMMETVAKLTPWTHNVIEALIPRPITFLLLKKKRVPGILTGGSDVVGVRIPNHMFALDMIALSGPITTTSANLHEGHEPHTIRSAIRQLGEAVDLYVDCGKTAMSSHSTLLDLTAGNARGAKIRRKGAADEGDILDIVAMTQ
jgi:L-threonylcarbamoyladenylate synthase